MGLIHSNSASWNVWVGGSVSLRPTDSPLGLEVEYGAHQVPTQYWSQLRKEVVREFKRWKPFLRVSLVL